MDDNCNAGAGDVIVQPHLVRAWLAARSLARGLPAPVDAYGGYRVDTDGDTEIRRWVFPAATAGISALADSITLPGYLIKLCGAPEKLRPLLPDHWHVQASGYFMGGTGTAGAAGKAAPRPCPPGYLVETAQAGGVTAVRIVTSGGERAASGYAAETEKAFVVDRIATVPDHQRKGLGSVLMAALLSHKVCAATPELLVATEAGCALYKTLGWRVISTYATGELKAA